MFEAAAQRTCRALAEENGESSRVVVGAELRREDVAGFAGRATPLVCDIEGAGLELVERFATSHEIELFAPGSRDIAAFPELASLEHLDQLLAFWEWRTTPTPWASWPRGAANPRRPSRGPG